MNVKRVSKLPKPRYLLQLLLLFIHDFGEIVLNQYLLRVGTVQTYASTKGDLILILLLFN
jgi:hypothetical protein